MSEEEYHNLHFKDSFTGNEIYKLLDGSCEYEPDSWFEINEDKKILLKNYINDLQQRINNAIEYIKYWHYRNDYNPSNFILDCQKELLSILEGKELE